MNIDFKVEERDDIQIIENLYEGGYNTKYDRLWSRTFDNEFAIKLFGKDVTFNSSLKALEKCIRKCLENPEHIFFDKEFNEKMDLYEQGELLC